MTILLEIRHRLANDRDDEKRNKQRKGASLPVRSQLQGTLNHMQFALTNNCSTRLLAATCAIVVCLANSVSADHLYLKNGLHIKGVAAGMQGLDKPYAERDVEFEKEIREAGLRFKSNPQFRLIDDGVRRYMVHRKQVAELIQDDELGRIVSFKLQHDHRSRTSGLHQVGAFSSVQPFDKFGRRTVMLRMGGRTVPIIQGITELRPDYTQLLSLSHKWDYAIDTKMIPLDIMQAVIQSSSDMSDPDERKAVVLFFIQANMYPQAKEELRTMQSDFPDLAEWCDEYLQQIEESQGLQLINEIERRRDSGQHRLAYAIAKQFPEDKVSAGVLRKAKELSQNYTVALEERDQVIMMLDVLQAELPMELAIELKSLRAKLVDELYYETMNRLQPFLRADLDDTLKPDQKLALAYSGWLLGGADAFLDLKQAIRLWEARYLVLEYLRTDRDPRTDEEIIAKLNAVEGFSVERLAKMIALLPIPHQAILPEVGSVNTVEVSAEDDEVQVRYSMMLPPEYSPHHRYPVIVALRGEGRTFENTVRWWGGDKHRPGWAQRRGYIVIAPHYTSETATDHDYSSTSHNIVLDSLAHLRQHFRVDSDRVFVSGHGMGGDACFDVALSNPGVFAGAIPFTGVIDKFPLFYWENAPHLSWYVVGGQRDRETFNQNKASLTRLMKDGQDVLYCEYKERGFESYTEEQERVFEWMQTRRRAPLSDLKEFETKSLRPTDNQFHWFEAEALQPQLYKPISWQASARKTPRTFSGNINPGGSIHIKHPGRSTILHLSPELFDFNNRCELHINTRQVFRDFVIPSIQVMLEDLRERGDRERLYWARIESTNRETVVR